MPTVTIRRISGDQELLEDFSRLPAYSFGATPPFTDIEQRRERLASLKNSTVLVLYEDGQPVGTSVSIPLTQNVRGRLFTTGGVGAVSMLPTARRRGYARRLLLRLFEEMHAQGCAFTALHPFRESFYERLGFATFPQVRVVHFKPQTLLPVFDMPTTGEIRLSHLNDSLGEYQAFLRQMQACTHGMALYDDETTAARVRGSERWLARAVVDGETRGIARYHITGYEGQMHVDEFYALDPNARYLLLDWCARHSDQVAEVRLHLTANDLPETWLADMAVKSQNDIWLTPMGRVLDVRRLQGLPCGSGRFTARITDSTCPWNNGVYVFESTAGELHVTPANDAQPACELTIHALSALVFGTHDPRDFAFRSWGRLPAAVIPQLEAMFPRQRPHLHVRF